MADPSPHDFRSYSLGEVQTVNAGQPFVRVEAGFGFRLYEATPAIQPPSFTSVPLQPWPDRKQFLLKAFSPENPDEVYLEDPETSVWLSVTSEGRVLRGWVSPADASPLQRGEWPENVRFRESGEVLKTEGRFLGLLLFTGARGNTLGVLYREYPQGAAGPSTSEELRFDLSQSRVIKFRSLEIEILEADEASLTFRVLSDGGLPWLERR